MLATCDTCGKNLYAVAVLAPDLLWHRCGECGRQVHACNALCRPPEHALLFLGAIDQLLGTRYRIPPGWGLVELREAHEAPPPAGGNARELDAPRWLVVVTIKKSGGERGSRTPAGF